MKRTINYIICIFSMLAVLSCKGNKKETPKKAQTTAENRIVISKEQFQKNNMSLGTVTEKLFPTTIKVNGMIDVPPESKAIVSPIIGGYIKTIPLLVGDKIKKGQQLVTLENPEFVKLQQEYLETKEQLNYLKSEYERQKTMYDEDVISEKKYLMAESQYKSANAKCNGLKNQLTMLNINPKQVEQGKITSVIPIYAPISGSITKVNISKGTYVSPMTSILEIIDNSHVHLELSVFEKDILNIKTNQHITFSIPESSQETYKAKVYLVGTSIEKDRTIKVHGHPTDESNIFLTGMFVNAEIIINKTKAKALPEMAIVEVDGNFYTLVLKEEDDINFYFKKIKITTGKTSNAFTELKGSSFLNPSEKILVNGAFSLIEGD